jgi:hypothetical protein
MTTDDGISSKDVDVEARNEGRSIDIRDLYKFDPEDLNLNISSTHYSNLTYMQVASREVMLDFLELPGIKRDEKMAVNGVRIYMSHVAAHALVEKLGKLLEKAYLDGKIAQLEITATEDIKLSTETTRQTEDSQT